MAKVKGTKNLGFTYDKKFCDAFYTTLRRLADPDKLKARADLLRRRRGEEVIAYYGKVCACCGEYRYEFLALDHINNDGSKHRKELRGHYYSFREYCYRFRPTGLQVLCHNCNMAKGIYGLCPHLG